ncbi:hypothetical protein BT96DRAFT_950079 [Gymnopus androsaceus JB14]|uniref:Uncharacterized protein n=1 Tax=Gymnopus androsaceus JB14 TaxID=1447944 RepID=A0A6A4GIL9_9AGAR|nr:hypothetical protein BT96DRAFT_950079 [Gymnopus androsaceus JB14]
MPCIWERHACMIREARNHIYSKVTKNEHQQLIIAVKKQEVEVSKLMDDGSDKYEGKVLTLNTLRLQLLVSCISLKNFRIGIVLENIHQSTHFPLMLISCLTNLRSCLIPNLFCYFDDISAPDVLTHLRQARDAVTACQFY